jgi:outer membrane receptor protein involved in Fe transport
VVTAQRRSESLQRAALAVSAVSGDALATAGITRPTDLGTVVPVLQIAPAAGPYTLFYLRGVGNFNGNALSDPAIAFNFDGVYVGRPSATTGFFYDIDRVEVLKGLKAHSMAATPRAARSMSSPPSRASMKRRARQAWNTAITTPSTSMPR